MYRVGLLITSFVIALWSFPAAAQQQPPCVDRADFLEHLSSNYEEAPVAMSLTTMVACLKLSCRGPARGPSL